MIMSAMIVQCDDLVIFESDWYLLSEAAQITVYRCYPGAICWRIIRP